MFNSKNIQLKKLKKEKKLWILKKKKRNYLSINFPLQGRPIKKISP